MKKIRIFLRRLGVQIKDTFLRYPLSMILIAAGFGISEYMTWYEMVDSPLANVLERLINVIYVALPLFTVVPLFKLRKWTYFFALGLAGLFYYLQGSDIYSFEFSLRTFLWGLAFYGALFYLPQWKKNPNNGFWSYVERLTFIAVLAFICNGILVISLELALFSIRTLFELNLDYRWEEAVALAGFAFFLPIFIHVGLPKNMSKFEINKEYPNFVKPLAYYLLLPIAFLYFGILTVYVGQILITWEWPSGQVAYPVLYLALLVFATYYAAYPWTKKWLQYGFLFLLPFLAVYFVALYLRIEEHGLTEMRILGVLLGVVLTVLCLYFWLSRKKRLQISFLILASVAFISTFGPWGIYELSVRSQINRLEVQLTEIGALQNGVLTTVDASTLSAETVGNISGTVDYLVTRSRLDEVQKWTDLSLSGEYPDIDARAAFMEEMGLTFTYPGSEFAREKNAFQYGVKEYARSLDISGYDALFTYDFAMDPYSQNDESTYAWNFEEDNVTLSLNEDGSIVMLYSGDELEFSLLDLHRELSDVVGADSQSLEDEQLTVFAENSALRGKLYIEWMDGAFADDEETTLERIYVRGQLLLDEK